MKFKLVHHFSRTAEGLCITIGYFSSEDFLDEHHSFNEIEAVHRWNHRIILRWLLKTGDGAQVPEDEDLTHSRMVVDKPEVIQARDC